MNRPKRPSQPPPRRRPSGPPTGGFQGGPPRRRSPLDTIPPHPDFEFKVLGGPVDRYSLIAAAMPLELVVIQGFTREIEDAFQKSGTRNVEDFWTRNPKLYETLVKMDEVLAGIQARKTGKA